MAMRVEAREAAKRLAEYLARAAQQGERILVVDRGKPVAALVSVEDLRRLEGETEAALDPDTDPTRRAEYRRRMEAAGLVVGWPTGEPVPLSERHPIAIEGPPVSEQILAERR